MSNKSLSSKRKSPTTMEFDEEAMKKALRLQDGPDVLANKKAASLAEMLPTFERNEKGVVKNDAFDRLFVALVGHTDKQWDSDDSIISEIDFMDDEVIAEKDRQSKALYEWSSGRMDDEIKRVEATLEIGKETKEERDARRKKLREAQMGLVTDEEKAAAERKWQRKQKRQADRLAKKIEVFTDEIKDPDATFVTCATFSALLEVMASVTPEEDPSRDPEKRMYRHGKFVKKISMEDFAKEIKFMGIKSNFYKQEASTEKFMVSAVKRILNNDDVLDVFNNPARYGFNFTTKECIQALEKYYTFNRPTTDNGSSIEPLAIHIRQLVKSAFHVARDADRDFVTNENLKSVLFD